MIMKKIVQFTSVTGENPETATFFLESCNGDYNLALENYFNSKPPHNDSISSSVVGPNVSGGDDRIGKHDEKFSSSANSSSSSSSSSSKPAPTKPKTVVGLRTFSDFANDAEEDQKAGGGEQTYAGGTTSGLNIIQPGKGGAKPVGGSNRETAEEIMRLAKERGVPTFDQYASKQQQQQQQIPSFGGSASSGRRLGHIEDHNNNLPSENATTSKKEEEDDKEKEIEVKIFLWNDGFSVDDGPLRDLNTPEGVAFMSDLRNGVVPAEIVKTQQQQALSAALSAGIKTTTSSSSSNKRKDPTTIPAVVVHLIRKESNYVVPLPPAKVFTAFSGSGHSLVASSSTTTAVVPSSSSSSSSSSSPSLIPISSVDYSKEVVTIQIRLSDGTRLVSKFNLNSTIRDIRNFVDSARLNHKPYDLITTMPRMVFSDLNQTVESAGLKNAVLKQCLK